MMAGLGDIASGIGSMFEKNPADAANKYYNQIPGMLNSTYQPWMQQGQNMYAPLSGYVQNGENQFGNLKNDESFGNSGMNTMQGYMENGLNAGNTLNSQLTQMAQNPGQYMNHIGQSFQQSPGYGWDVNQATMAANRAAAAGGMAGSPQEQQTLAQNIMGMANQNYGNWMSRAIGVNQQGLSGLQGIYQMGGMMGQNAYNQGVGIGQNMYGLGAHVGQNVYDTGANMANQYGTNMADSMENQGNLAYAGQQNQNQQMMGGLGQIAGGLEDIF